MTATTLLFLDVDHVLDLARTLLADPDDAIASARAFLAPEPPPEQRLRAIACGLRRGDGVEAIVASSDPRTKVAQMREATVLLLRRGSVTAATFAESPRLALVQRLGGCADAIDLAAAARAGVPVSCLPRRTLIHTAEHTLMLILAVTRQVMPATAAMRVSASARAPAPAGAVAYNWVDLGGIAALHGRTLGIIGLGEVGRLVAARARGFGMRVLYTQRHRLAAAREATLGVEHRTLRDLLADSDVVSIHVNSGDAPPGLVGRDEFAAMRRDAILINTSRGALVDEDALFDALTAGRLFGAGLDVHAVEPRPAHDRFLDLPNVVLTPHVAGGSRIGVLDEIEAMYSNIRAALAGASPPHGLVTASAVSDA